MKIPAITAPKISIRITAREYLCDFVRKTNAATTNNTPDGNNQYQPTPKAMVAIAAIGNSDFVNSPCQRIVAKTMAPLSWQTTNEITITSIETSQPIFGN